jgi:hypothetical protein
MAKLTKTQIKNLYRAILSKSKKLYMSFPRGAPGTLLMSTKDLETIENIVRKYQRKM